MALDLELTVSWGAGVEASRARVCRVRLGGRDVIWSGLDGGLVQHAACRERPSRSQPLRSKANGSG